MPRFEKTSLYPVSAEELYKWHARNGAFERLSPPWDHVRTAHAEGGIEDGALRIMKLKKGPLSLTWEAHHKDHIPGRQFVDVQVKGPFKSWVHTHRFEEAPDEQSRLVDSIEYKLPLGPLGAFFGSSSAEKTLQRMFAFRHRRTGEDLRRHNETPRDLKVAITSTDSSLGNALWAFLSTGGHQVLRIDPTNAPAQTDLEGLDALIHLPTRQDPSPLLKTLKALDKPPAALLLLSSAQPRQSNHDTEAALQSLATEKDLRLCVCTPGKILNPGPSGAPKINADAPWIDIDDLLGALLFLASRTDMEGDFHLLANPQALKNGSPRLLPDEFEFFYPTIKESLDVKLGRRSE